MPASSVTLLKGALRRRRSITGAATPRLLSINNNFYRRGGSEAVFFEHNRLIEEAGWSAIPFAMQDIQNFPTPWSKHFVNPVDFRRSQPIGSKLVAASKIMYSFEARRRIRQLLTVTSPSIAGTHNIYHHLSPSILGELRR